MELIKEAVTVGEILFSDSFETMVDGDLIVPDVKPDILKILQVDASSCISSKEITNGRMTLSGRIDLTVLYIPDREDSNIQNIRTSFNFTHKVDKAVIDESCSAFVNSDISKVEFHVINSRKISLKAITAIECEIVSSHELSFLTGIDEENAQICTKSVSVNSLCGVSDEEFVIRESVEIPAGKSSIGEILKIDYKICDKELKPITEKLVAKGMLNVCVLYKDIMDNLEFTEMEIPFTEVFDFPYIDEDMTCDLNYRVCDCSFDTAEDNDGDRRIVNLEVLVCAEMKASQNREMNIISDCFCPGYETQLSFQDVTLNEIVSSPSTQNSLREVAVIDKSLPQISGVYNVITKAFVTKSHTEDNKLSIEGKIEAYILYLTDNAETPVYSFKKDIPFSYLLDSPKVKSGMSCSVSAEVAHTSFHLNVANEVELRCILNISANVFSDQSLSLITDAEIFTIPQDKKKGIVIYFVQPGDTLWKIAKNYCVSVEDIVKYNQIPDKDDIKVAQRLVIPAACGI